MLSQQKPNTPLPIMPMVFDVDTLVEFFDAKENLDSIYQFTQIREEEVTKVEVDATSVLSSKHLDIWFRHQILCSGSNITELRLTGVIVTMPIHIHTTTKTHTYYLQLRLNDSISIMEESSLILPFNFIELSDIDADLLHEAIIHELEDMIGFAEDIWCAEKDEKMPQRPTYIMKTI